MKLRVLRDACAGGFLYGALLYGATLALLHAVHNHAGSTHDALLILFYFGLLYGLWSAAFFLASMAAMAATMAVWPFSGPETLERRGLAAGLFVYNLFFWEVALLYGLTYAEAPFHPAGAWGMAAVLAVLAAGIAAGVSVVSWGLFRLFTALDRQGWLGRAAALLAVLAVALNAEAPFFTAAVRPKPVPAPKLAMPAGTDTGLKVVLVGLDGPGDADLDRKQQALR